MLCVTAGDSKNAPARGGTGRQRQPWSGRAVRLSITCAGCPARGLATPPEPSAVTSDGIQRSSAVPSVRSAPGLGQITDRGGPGRGADAAEPHVPGSQCSRAVCSADVAGRNGLLSHQHRSIWRRNHDDVTSPWSGPLQSHIVVVTRTTPSRVHALRRGCWAVQVAPRQPRDARDGWCCVGSGGEVASRVATKQAAARGQWRSGRFPCGNRPRCARARAVRSGGAPGSGGGSRWAALGSGGGFG